MTKCLISENNMKAELYETIDVIKFQGTVKDGNRELSSTGINRRISYYLFKSLLLR